MGKSEPIGVFQAVSQKPVDADVIDPDKREGQQAVGMQQ